MNIANAGEEPPDRLQDGTRRAEPDAERREGAASLVTLTTFIDAPSQRALRALLLVTLTLAAGWTDALCYLAVGRVFASFMTGNILFVGLSIAQGNTALLVRAGTAAVIFPASVMLGELYLQELPARQPVGTWRGTLARYLLVEGLVLLAFALLWSLAGNPAQHPAMQVILLGIAAFSMGLQGALVRTFNIRDVVSVALTGTELFLGMRLAMRLAQRIGRRSTDLPGGVGVPFLLALMLSYTLAALVVGLAMPWFGFGIAFIPCLLFAAAVVVLATLARRKTSTGGVSAGEEGARRSSALPTP